MIKEHFLKLKLLLVIMIFFSFQLIFNNIFGIESSDILCNKALIMDKTSGSVIYSKNGFEKVFPASTTKVLTAILVIENLDLDKPVVASENAIYSTPEGSSSMYIKIGEILTVKQLLYGLMLPSRK